MSIIINNQLRPEVDFSTIQVHLPASDPMASCSFTLIDTGAALTTIKEFQEAIILDDGAFPNQTVNLLQNPLINPYTTSWSNVAQAGITHSQGAPNGVVATVSNAAVATLPFRSQTLPVFTAATGMSTMLVGVIVGQIYTASCGVTGASIVALKASVTITYLDATQAVLTTQIGAALIPTGAAQTLSATGTAPAGAQYIKMTLNVQATNATNSGTITYAYAQVEPQLFASLGTLYPTPQCTSDQTNCTALANGTCVRQQRLFAGFITHLLYHTFTGPNRHITVTATGPALLLETQVLAEVRAGSTDGNTVLALIAGMPGGILSTNHVKTDGITLDDFTLTNDTARVGIDSLASISGWRWYADPYYDLWYVPPGFYAQPVGLSDAPDFVTTFAFANYSRENDFTQPCNSVLAQYSSTGTTAAIIESASRNIYDWEFMRKINNQAITTAPTAYQIGLAEVVQFAYGRAIIHLEVDDRRAQPILPNNTIQVTNSVDGITQPTSYLVQKVTITCLGVDKGQNTRWLYALDLGAYQPELTSILFRAANDATMQPNTLTVTVNQYNLVVLETLGSVESYSHTP